MKAALSFSIRLTLVFFSFQLAGQTGFSRVYWNPSPQGGLYYSKIINTENNGFMLAASTGSSGLLIRLDSLGSLMWSKEFDPSLQINDMCIAKDATHFILALRQDSTGDYPVVIKINAQGAMSWIKKIQYPTNQNPVCLSISTTLDSGAVLCGYFSVYPKQTFAAKFDKSGNLNWSKTINVRDSSAIYRSIRQLPDSDFILAGNLHDSIASLLKLSKTGLGLWCKSYSLTNAMNVSIADIAMRNNKVYSYFFSKKHILGLMDSLGNCISGLEYSNSGPDVGTTFPSIDGRLYAASSGFFITGQSYYNNGIIYTDSVGNPKWSNRNYMRGMATTLTGGQGFCIIGEGPFWGFRATDILSEIGLVKIDSLGYGGCTNRSVVTVSNVALTNSSESYTIVSLGSAQIHALNTSTVTIAQKSGCIDFYNPGIHEYNNKENVFVYPNPSSGVISIQLKNNYYYSVLKYSIINLNGEIVKEEFTDKSELVHKIDCSSIAPGAYVLKVSDKQNVIASRHLIITP